jgi:hypothetical protein
MKTSRLIVVMMFVGFLALSGVPASFGQCVTVPSGPPLPQDPQPAPAAGAPPQGAAAPAAGALPPAAQPAPPAGALPPDPQLPTVGSLPPDPQQPLPAAGALPQGSQPALPAGVIPPTTVQDLGATLGSQLIGSSAFLLGGGRIGTVRDLISVGGFEYLLVSYRNRFVTIPRSLTIFEPVPRVCLVRLTGAQFGGLPLITQLSQFNDRRFVQRFDSFFRGQRGQAILRGGFARDTRAIRTVPPNRDRRRDETRTAGKPVIPPQTRPERSEQRFTNGTDTRR